MYVADDFAKKKYKMLYEQNLITFSSFQIIFYKLFRKIINQIKSSLLSRKFI